MTIAKTSATLGEFLHQAEVKYRVFDMGRRVAKLTPEEFVCFEHTTRPYPYPLLKTAYLGIVFWKAEYSDLHYVWFLHFPLDEQGKLIHAARDELLAMLLERTAQEKQTHPTTRQLESALKDNPYAFKPRPEKMAAFHALVTTHLGLKPSSFYETARAYFTEQQPLDAWPELGMQGVADFAARLENDAQAKMGLIKRLAVLPPQPFMMLATFLEHAHPPADIVEVLAQMLAVTLQEDEPDVPRICACLRAASNSPATGLVELMVKHVLQHDCSRDIEILATIDARIWAVLRNDKITALFLQRLAENSAGQTAFSQILTDLMFMPGLRSSIMQGLRSPQRAVTLSQAVGKMFGRPL